MIFGLFKKKKMLIDLSPREELEIEVPVARRSAGEAAAPPGESGRHPGRELTESESARPPEEEEEQPVRLYAEVIKVSKKKNIFVRFLAGEGESSIALAEQVHVGGEVTIAVLKQGKISSFPSTLLHREGEVFIFAPPAVLSEVKLPHNPFDPPIPLELPVEYRAMSSAHLQKGTVQEVGEGKVAFFSNVPIPEATQLNLEVHLPHRALIRAKGKVLTSEPLPVDARKKKVTVSFVEIRPEDQRILSTYALFQFQRGKESLPSIRLPARER